MKGDAIDNLIRNRIGAQRAEDVDFVAGIARRSRHLEYARIDGAGRI